MTMGRGNESHTLMGVVAALTACYRSYWFYLSPPRFVHRREMVRFFGTRPRSRRVLEVGGGTGMMVSTLRRACRPDDVVCSDLDPRPATRIICDATALPFADSTFDVVAAFEVLEHLPDTGRFLSENRRVLRQNGHLALSVPFLLGIHDYRDFYRFTDRGLAEILSAHGFCVIHLCRVGGILLSVVGLLIEFVRGRALGQQEGWRGQKLGHKVNLAVTTVATAPLVVLSWAALFVDSIFDRGSTSPAGFVVIAQLRDSSPLQ